MGFARGAEAHEAPNAEKADNILSNDIGVFEEGSDATFRLRTRFNPREHHLSTYIVARVAAWAFLPLELFYVPR
jgi:hypothetical protein